jgi:hypothetical protein
MSENRSARFNAEKVAKVVTANGQRHLDLVLTSADGAVLVVSMPLHEALAVARLICDYEEQAPFVRPGGERKNGLRA